MSGQGEIYLGAGFIILGIVFIAAAAAWFAVRSKGIERQIQQTMEDNSHEQD